MPAAYVYEDSSVGWRTIQAGDIPAGSGSPLTTKGDLYGFSSANARIPVGADGTVLSADSTQTLGVKWVTVGGGTISDITSTGSSITVGAPTGPTTNVDVAASGVTAATYGDTTHVAQVTVGADGRVTNASSVAISGSAGAGGLIVLYESTLVANAASLDTGAGGIAGGHHDLMVLLYVRTTRAAIQDNLTVLLNNDSGAHYDNERLQGASTTAAAVDHEAQSTVGFGVTCASATEAANVFSAIRLMIPSYDNTVGFKVGELSEFTPSQTATNQLVHIQSWSWRSTAAISRIGITSATASNLLAGSRLVVYGLQ